MKTGWVILIAVAALIVGGFGGMVMGGVGGAAGGSIVGVCYTTRVAMQQGMLTADQSDALLQAIAAKGANGGSKLGSAADLKTACSKMSQ